MALSSRGYGWYVLGLLAVVNFFNYANRNVVFPMYDDLRATFALSNAELGLLGTVFMLSHALVTVPIGWAADRYDRRKVMAWGLLLWSVAAVGSAAAAGLGSLLVSRALIGIGTAACVPVGNALLCDVFPAESKARTVSVFNVGLFAGGAAGFALGALFGFPLAFVLVALPGLLLALLVVRLDIPATRAQVGPGQVVSFAAFRRDAIAVLRIRTMRWMLVGGALMAFAAGGYVAWFADFVAHYKGMTIERATLVFGGAAVTGGLAGVLAGGVVGDWLVRRLPYGRLATITFGFGITVPFALLAVFVDAGWVFYVSIWLTMFFITWYHGPMAAVVDDVVDDRRATTGQATFLFVMHLFGTAPAPYVVGLLADGFGLRAAMLAPTAAVGLAALAFMAGWPAVEGDRDAAGHGRGDRV